MSSGSPYPEMRTNKVRITPLSAVDSGKRSMLYPQLTSMLAAGCAEEQRFTASSATLLELGCHDLQEDLLAGGSGWFIAFYGESPIGLVCLASAGSSAPRTGVLAGLYVDPLWRRQGVGSGLVYAVLNEARARSLLSVVIYVAENNPARLLYIQLGFGDEVATEQAEFRRLEYHLGKERRLGAPANIAEPKEVVQVRDKKLLPFMLRAVAVAMGVATIVLSVIHPIQVERVSLLLGIGLASLAISTLND